MSDGVRANERGRERVSLIGGFSLIFFFFKWEKISQISLIKGNFYILQSLKKFCPQNLDYMQGYNNKSKQMGILLIHLRL